MMMSGEVARRLGVRPKTITDLFYAGKLRDDLCPVYSGRRMIPEGYIVEVEAALRRAGKLGATKGGAL